LINGPIDLGRIHPPQAARVSSRFGIALWRIREVKLRIQREFGKWILLQIWQKLVCDGILHRLDAKL
jgi:hypothetical protein